MSQQNISKIKIQRYLEMDGFTPKIFLRKKMDIITLLIEKKISIKTAEGKPLRHKK